MKSFITIAMSSLLSSAIVLAEEDAPLHLVISKVGNKIATYGTKDEPAFMLMAEIQNSLVFSIQGDFEKAEIVSASTVAPDGKTYQLKAIGEQQPDSPGTVLKYLYVTHGEAHTGFSIGKWKVDIKFNVDDKPYAHTADYLITWRKPDEGIWGGQYWANESKEAEQAGTGQPATSPESKSEGSQKPQPESEGRSR